LGTNKVYLPIVHLNLFGLFASPAFEKADRVTLSARSAEARTELPYIHSWDLALNEGRMHRRAEFRQAAGPGGPGSAFIVFKPSRCASKWR
jgi:hypothetical protein